MKKIPLFFLASFFVCFISLSSCRKDAAFNCENKPGVEKYQIHMPLGRNIVVSGGGTTLEFGAKTTYEFNAVQSKGKTTGHFILKFRAAGGSLWVDLDCLRVFDGNKATISGLITRVEANGETPPPFIFVGGRVSFTCQDNGEGASAPADMVSDIGELPGVPASCADVWPLYLPLDGNVQIKN
ncbi:MAG: hypothetical protein V4717_10565 [Bacteroidota bacterium]